MVEGTAGNTGIGISPENVGKLFSDEFSGMCCMFCVLWPEIPCSSVIFWYELLPLMPVDVFGLLRSCALDGRLLMFVLSLSIFEAGPVICPIPFTKSSD